MRLTRKIITSLLALFTSAVMFAQQGGGGGGGGGIPGPTGSGQCFISTSAGAGNWTWGSCSGSSSLAFASLTTGTNTTATMTIGSGATLTSTSGSIFNFAATSPLSFKIPTVAGAVPTVDGTIGFNSTTHLPVWGSNGSTISLLSTIANDTNVTGTLSLENATLTLGWTGTLAAGRLNANVVQSITNDTNVTGTISAQALTLGWTGTLAKTRALSTTVYTDQGNTYSTGAQNFNSATATDLRIGAGLTTSANGDIGYDTTNKNWHVWQNGVDSYLLGGPVSSTYTNGDCVEFAKVSSVITLVDAGAACGSGGGGGVTSVTGDGTVFNNSASTGSVTLHLANAPAGTLLGNNTSSPAAPIYTSTPQLGAAGTLGSVTFGNATSGLLTLQPVTGALGTVTASLPANTGTVAETNLAQTFSALQTFGSNASIAATAHGVLLSENTGAVVATAVGAANTVLLGNSAADPSFGAVPLTAMATQSANTMLANFTASSAAPTAIAMPTTGTNGCAGATNALIYNTTTHALGCNTISTASVALSGLTAASGANTLANGNNGAQVWNWAQTTASQTALTLGETTAATGTGDQELAVTTIAGSTAIPVTITDSLTGTQVLSALQILPTWNTTGVVDAGIFENVTNTASGSGSLLIDLQVGGTSQFSVDKAGNENLTGGLTISSATAGIVYLGQGTAQTTGTTSIGLTAPTSVTSYNVVLPGTIGSPNQVLQISGVTGSVATTTWATPSSSTIYQVNGTGLTSSSTIDFLNSAATNGQTFTFTNTSAGNIQLGVTGTLSNAGLANSSITVTGTAPVGVSGSPVSLGGTVTLSLLNSAAGNVTAAYGTDTAYFTASGGAATNGHSIEGDTSGGIKDSGSALVTPSSTTTFTGKSLSLDQVTGSAAQATATETGISQEWTYAGVETGNLTSPIVFQNTNSTNNNTSASLIVNAPGTSTGQLGLIVNGAGTGGDLIRGYSGSTITSGVLSGGTLEFEVQNGGTLISQGSLQLAGHIQSATNPGLIYIQSGIDNTTTSVGLMTVRGGDITGGSSAVNGGNTWLRGGNNASTSTTSAAGITEFSSGASTGATPGLQGLLLVVNTYAQTGTVTQWNIECFTSTAKTVDDCGATPSNIAGVALSKSSTVEVNVAAPPSEIPINASAAVTVGHTVCAGSTAGQITDSGGTAACASGTTIGTVIAISGSYPGFPDGTAFPTLSSTLPLIRLTGVQPTSAGAGGTPPLSSVTGASSQATGTETGAGNNYTLAGVETAALTYPFVITNNSASNNTSGALIIGTTGTGTGQVPLLINEHTSAGDLVDMYNGGTVTNGVESGGAKEFAISNGGVITTGSISTAAQLPGSGSTTVNGQTCTLGSTCAVESATAGQVAISGGSGAALTGSLDLTYSVHTFSGISTTVLDLSAATGTAALRVPTNSTNIASSAGAIDFDTTNKNYHGYVNGGDSLFLNITSAPANNHVLYASVSSGNTLMADAGYAYNAIPLSDLATQANNTVLGNFGSGTAAPTANSVASCSGNNDGEIYTTNTGFGCGTNFAQLNVAESFSALQTFTTNASIGTTAHGVLISEGASAAVATATGGSGVPLIGQGASSDPVFGAINLAGGSTIVTGVLPYANMTQGAFDSTSAGLTTPTGNGSFTFPNTATTGLTLAGTAPASVSTSTGTNAMALLTISGVTGGATSNATGTAGIGSSPSISAGAGGAGTGTNAVGGAGGSLALTTGGGGASLGTGANSNGGTLTVTLGAPGTGGSGAAGANGNSIFQSAGIYSFELVNTTSTAVANSPLLRLQGEYEATSGPTYAADYWTWQDVIGSGVNGTSTLTAAHTGSSGTATISLPALTISGLGAGVVQSSSGGALSSSALALTSLATQAANTVLGNFTSGTATPTATAVASCSAANDAEIYTTSTGFGCGTNFVQTNQINTGTSAMTLNMNASTSAPSVSLPAVIGGTQLSGTSTANLSAPIVIQNTNSTNNNTSITLGITSPGTSTGQTTLNINGATTGGDLTDWGTGGTWASGVLSGQTNVAKVGITGAFTGLSYTSNGTTAGFLDLPQGTTSAAVAPCNTATSICIQAPTAVTSQLRVLAGAPATGFTLWTNSSGTMTETISPTSSTLNAGPALLGTFAINSVIASTVANAAGHFTNLQVVTTLFNTCTTVPIFNVFDGTTNVGSTVTATGSTQTKGTGTSTAQTLTFASGDIIGIYVSTAGATCTADQFIVSAQYSVP